MKVVAGILVALCLVTGCTDTTRETVATEPSASAAPEPTARGTDEPRPAKTSDPTSAKRTARRVAAVKAARVRKAVARRRAAVRKVRRAVLGVVDGDTVRLDYRGGVSVRVIGIDTPEKVSPSVPDECGGQAASTAAARMLTGKSVTMTFDPTQDRVDRYGRPLAYLGVPGIGDFGRAMIRRGLAAEYTYDAAYQNQSVYRSAERAARRARRGLWGKCGGPDKPSRKPAPVPFAGGVGRGCAARYRPCVPPFPPDRDCDDVDGPITVTGSDPHELDSDGDGVACES